MIGEAIKIITIFSGQTQQELAQTLGISDSYLSQIESGKRKPTLETISAISGQFRIPVSSLVFFQNSLVLIKPQLSAKDVWPLAGG